MLKRIKSIMLFIGLPATIGALLLCFACAKKVSGSATASSAHLSRRDSSANMAKVLDEIASRMVKIEGGSYTMGCTPEQEEECMENELETKKVTVGSFSLSKYEVTQAEWAAIMGYNPSAHKDCADCPVENLSLKDIKEFIVKLNAVSGKNYRLPTQEEWEYAARGGNQSKAYKYAGSNNLNDVAWFDETSDKQTHPIGQKKPNELGLYDMSGNVYEWCSDEFVRGGSFQSTGKYCRVPAKSGISTAYRYEDNGIRLAIN